MDLGTGFVTVRAGFFLVLRVWAIVVVGRTVAVVVAVIMGAVVEFGAAVIVDAAVFREFVVVIVTTAVVGRGALASVLAAEVEPEKFGKLRISA